MLDSSIYSKVRLKPEYLDTIVTAFKNNFATTDHLWIFGSRIDMSARGGDIDLYIESPATDAEKITQQRVKFIGAIWKVMGEQKIDVVINLTMDKIELPIYVQAIRNGVQLV